MQYVDFAILAPVPKEHLDSGVDTCVRTGYVCFGSNKWELFRLLDARGRGAEVPVLIYASHSEDLADWGYVVAWTGTYIGSIEDSEAKREEERTGHRPPTTSKYRHDNAIEWAIFWKVKGLIQLPAADRKEIRELQSFLTGEDRMNKAPRGPEIIVRPPWI
jgi:hypothetical protein